MREVSSYGSRLELVRGVVTPPRRETGIVRLAEFSTKEGSSENDIAHIVALSDTRTFDGL